jgi:two-component system, OmpR family, sensor histidine kinase KdpD
MPPTRVLNRSQLSEPPRPDPEKLLARLKAEAARERPSRGRLRVYLGAAPGVGKTFAMLNEARRRLARGTDVVIGFVETYGRPLTVQAAEGLEVVPRRQVEYRGTTLEEMDTEAIIARHPAVVLVDELAHTNAPGSKHEKRWQEVEEILEAGISVITTVNIQHLESLRDRVEQITGIKVRETVPDGVIDKADDVELIDMAPEALRSRMRHGNIYPPDRAQRALQNFFRPGNLAALRELALRRTAEEVDDQLASYMQENDLSGWQVDERVLVCIDHRPISATVLRRGWLMAHRLKCPLSAVYVQRHDLTESQQAGLEQNKKLAADLNAEVHEIEGDDLVDAIAKFVAESRSTQVIVGHTQRSRWYEFLHGSLVQGLLRRLRDVDVHVVAQRPDEAIK